MNNNTLNAFSELMNSWDAADKLISDIVQKSTPAGTWVKSLSGTSNNTAGTSAKTPEVRPDTTTKLDIKNGKIHVKRYKDGFFQSDTSLMSDIKDVIVYDNTVIVKFSDGTKTVAVLDNEDEFNLEQGISICITKKLLGQDGSAIYNKLIKRALKVKKQREQAAAKKEQEKVEAEKRKAAALKRHQKKQTKKREARIAEMAEAYARAMEHCNEKL